ncbi:MAG TPA: flavin reductase family protein [Deltaproteobacteria bacterium]|nr:flavin reductase family protein [Deltaproteobacteria bacterium]HQI81760.1 flavin reductase family protein [Deltaproteobacteria bacterium]
MNKERLGPRTLLFPMPSVLIGSEVDGKPNFMTVAWCGIASHQPPTVSVAIRKGRHTLKGIDALRCFSVNIPTSKMVKTVDFCGIYSGKDRDKSSLFHVDKGENPRIPLIRECPVNLECTLLHSLDLGSHTLVIGEITQSHVRQDCLTGKKVDPLLVDPLIYATSSETYHKLGQVVGTAFQVGKEL